MALPFVVFILPILLIVMIFLVRYTIKKAQQNVNVIKHIRLRILILFAGIALLFLICYISWGGSGILAAIYTSACFTCLWLLYLLIEAICLIVVKQNALAKRNLAISGVFAAIIFLVFLKYWIIG